MSSTPGHLDAPCRVVGPDAYSRFNVLNGHDFKLCDVHWSKTVLSEADARAIAEGLAAAVNELAELKAFAAEHADTIKALQAGIFSPHEVRLAQDTRIAELEQQLAEASGDVDPPADKCEPAKVYTVHDLPGAGFVVRDQDGQEYSRTYTKGWPTSEARAIAENIAATLSRKDGTKPPGVTIATPCRVRENVGSVSILDARGVDLFVVHREGAQAEQARGAQECKALAERAARMLNEHGKLVTALERLLGECREQKPHGFPLGAIYRAEDVLKAVNQD